MRRATDIRRSWEWDSADAVDRIALDYDERHRRRYRFVAEGGTDFLLDLPRATVLQDGDGLVLEDGGLVEVRAAPEALVQITADDPQALVRLAWHIGNRHLPAQIDGTRIVIRRDHVIVAMLQGLGATVEDLMAPFAPEGGAYGGHGGHSHGH